MVTILLPQLFDIPPYSSFYFQDAVLAKAGQYSDISSIRAYLFDFWEFEFLSKLQLDCHTAELNAQSLVML